MAYEQKPNTGSLFPNSRKTEEKHPDFTGSINVDGKVYWLNMWDNAARGKTTGPRFGLTVRLKDQRPAADASAAPKRTPF